MGSPRANRAHVLAEAGIASIAAAVPAVAAMWPVLAHPGARVFGLPSDPLSEVWRPAHFKAGQIALIGNPATGMANAPSGGTIRRAIDVNQIVYDVPAWALAKLMSLVLAYNVLVFLAIWSAGLAMYACTPRVRSCRIGHVGGLLLYGPHDNFDLESSHVIPALIRKIVEAGQDPSATVELMRHSRSDREPLEHLKLEALQGPSQKLGLPWAKDQVVKRCDTYLFDR